MIINHRSRALIALFFCTVLTVHTPLFCPAGQDNDLELNAYDSEAASMIPKDNIGTLYQKFFGRIGEKVSARTTSIKQSISNNASLIKKVIAGTFIVLLSAAGGGFVMHEIMEKPPASLNLMNVPPCNITIALNPHDLPHCYGIPTDDTERALLAQKELQDLLVAVAACKAEETDDCADICSSHHEEFDFDLKERYDAQHFSPDHMQFYYYHPCPSHLPKESNFALCPVTLADIEECHTPFEPTPLHTLKQHTNITQTSRCTVRTVPLGFRRDTIGVAYSEARPEEGKLPHQRHRFNATLVKTCKPLQHQIQKAEKNSGCTVIIHE